MAELQAGQREQIKEKLFAIPPDRYPIHDVEHARNALVRVRQHGTPAEKSKVYAAVTKRYPALSTRSEVVPEKKQRTAEKKLGLGKGEESQKVEPAKQKLSSVSIAAFVDEVGEIKEAGLKTVLTNIPKAGRIIARKPLETLGYGAKRYMGPVAKELKASGKRLASDIKMFGRQKITGTGP